MSLRLYLQRRRITLPALFTFFGALLFFAGHEMPSGEWMWLALKPTAVIAFTCIGVVLFLPNFVGVADGLGIGILLLVTVVLAEYVMGPWSEPTQTIVLVAAWVLFIYVYCMGRINRFTWPRVLRFTSRFVTTATPEDIWRGMLQKPGEEHHDWSGTIVSVKTTGEANYRMIAALGRKQFTSTRYKMTIEHFPDEFAADVKMSIGQFEDGTFVSNQNEVTYSLQVCLEERAQGETAVTQIMTFPKAPLGYALGNWLGDFAADMETSMKAHFEKEREWSVLHALLARGRKEAQAFGT